jgi:hypothetical protein
MARFHDIEASIWEDLQGTTKDEKILYIYAFSNPLTRDSGLYKIGLDTIKVGTGLREKEIKMALEGLNPKVVYDFEQKVMFVAGKLKRRLSGLHSNRNIKLSIEHDLEAFKGSFVTSLFINKYEGALEGLKRPSISPPLPLPLPLNTTKGVIGGEEKVEAQEIYAHYSKPIKPGAKEDAIRSIGKLLKTGFTKEQLIGRIDAYKQVLLKKPTDYIIQANNFFGEKARYKDFEPIKVVEYLPPDPHCKLCKGLGKAQTGEGQVIRCGCVKEKKIF